MVAPSAPREAKSLLKSVIRDDNPVVYFWHKAIMGMKGDVPEEEYTIPFGQADVKRQGDDVTVVAVSNMVNLALDVARDLEPEGISAEVVDLRCLRPLDMGPVLESFRKTTRGVVVEEGWGSYGVGAEIVARIQDEAFDWMDAPVKRVSQAEVPLPYSRELEQSALPDAAKVIAAVREII